MYNSKLLIKVFIGVLIITRGGGDIFTPSKFQRREVVKKKTKPDLITGVKTFLRNSTSRHGDVHGTTRGQLKTPSRSKRPGTQENEVPADLRAERNDLDFNQFISSYPALPAKDVSGIIFVSFFRKRTLQKGNIKNFQ